MTSVQASGLAFVAYLLGSNNIPIYQVIINFYLIRIIYFWVLNLIFFSQGSWSEFSQRQKET